MVAWGYGAFENVTAMEWIDEIDDCNDISIVIEALEKAIEYHNSGEHDLLEEPFGSEAFAAVEVIAALFDKSCSNLPSKLKLWIKNKKKPGFEIKNFTLKALEAIQYNSELKNFWENSEKIEIWYEEIIQLKKRLNSIKLSKVHNKFF